MIRMHFLMVYLVVQIKYTFNWNRMSSNPSYKGAGYEQEKRLKQSLHFNFAWFWAGFSYTLASNTETEKNCSVDSVATFQMYQYFAHTSAASSSCSEEEKENIKISVKCPYRNKSYLLLLIDETFILEERPQQNFISVEKWERFLQNKSAFGSQCLLQFWRANGCHLRPHNLTSRVRIPHLISRRTFEQFGWETDKKVLLHAFLS